MKLRAISIAIVLASVAAVAMAGNPSHLMQPVTVSEAGIANCTPPNGSTGHACDSFDQMVGANFTPYEIGELFGYRTSYPDYKAARERLEARYDKLVQQYLAAHHQTANGTSVAAAR